MHGNSMFIYSSDYFKVLNIFKYFFSLKLKKEINEDEYNEQLRLKWEKDKQANLDKSTVRYEDIRFDGIMC